jgi:hypothetical protein
MPEFRALAILLVLASSLAAAQSTLAAPLPPQIAAAKKIFIANVPGSRLPGQSNDTALAYDDFYVALKSWGHYDLAAAPSDADLIFEISYVSAIAEVNGTKDSGCSSSNSFDLQLVIVDPKTRVPIWWLQQDIKGARRAKTWDKNFDDAMAILVGNVKIISNGSPLPAKP